MKIILKSKLKAVAALQATVNPILGQWCKVAVGALFVQDFRDKRVVREKYY